MAHVASIIDGDFPEFNGPEFELRSIVEVAIEKLDIARWKQVDDDTIKIQLRVGCFDSAKTLKENMISSNSWRIK